MGRVGVPQEDEIPNAQPTFYANITIAGGPAPVRAYIEELLPDVVLMDIRMPRRSGIEACTAIKDVAPSTKIVILTISDEESDLYEAVRAGANVGRNRRRQAGGRKTSASRCANHAMASRPAVRPQSSWHVLGFWHPTRMRGTRAHLVARACAPGAHPLVHRRFFRAG